MRFIPTRVHGIVDYVVGLLLIAAPWIFGFADVRPAMYVAVAVGLGVILYSLFTDYELGLMRSIPMAGHLWLDALGGAFLAVSPWLFDFADAVYLPHLIVGLGEIAAAVFTQTQPRTAATDVHTGRRHASPGA